MPLARVLAFSAALAVAALGLYAGVDLGEKAAVLPGGLPWWALVALFVAAERLVVEFPIRRQTWTISMDEVALTVGLITAAPTQLLTATIVAEVIVNVGLHRRPAQKSVYNVSATALRVAASAGLYHVLLGSTWPLDPAGWVVAFCAILIPSTMTFLTVPTVITPPAAPPCPPAGKDQR